MGVYELQALVLHQGLVNEVTGAGVSALRRRDTFLGVGSEMSRFFIRLLEGGNWLLFDSCRMHWRQVLHAFVLAHAEVTLCIA